ncbi:thioredoxin domain-containing protein [Chelativorans sp. M5D2P16]|uniref:thioredoxin domain-containing protein n=1 Tax=Chelativorans sp. M5D2P16 TaxID=3095678 RepID=UPI002AC9F349|nr:thioredoxin domain-containing protein [Chelativorans sp. M5D2P16]MDZ5697414.1 thioredoxin domain-containing protein [Chelativorans sp. M5D2P16]
MTVPLPQRNLLDEQTSPYLLQHKNNPVHWRAWSAEALAEAQALGKPILLSVGYAACHWCHVMAHESFEDPDVAYVMNRLFVNIKVDREERPDIDQIYMTALQATGEQGGWPLTMFLTPDAKPFWGGTYFPRTTRFGRPGFVQVLEAIHSAWREKKDELQRSAEVLSDHVQKNLAAPASGADTAFEPPLRALAQRIGSVTDPLYGGLKGAPKFPNAPFLDVLWLDWLEHRTAEHREAVVRTLRYIFSGGIYDHVGGGLARYATDPQWLVPHFEKMLYDNAQMVRLACYAHAETGDPLFKKRIDETLTWMLREMRVEGGAFASSLDADSEGEEGKFYLWTRSEIEAVLGSETERLLATYSLSQPEGWEGDPILHRLDRPSLESPSDEDPLKDLLDQLREAREKRPRPGRDDKVLVDWNGLAIEALATAGRQFAHDAWIEAARNAYHFVCESMQGGRLPHSIRAAKRLFPALASDYAAMISAAISLHGALQDEVFLQQAREWADKLEEWHADGSGTGYFLTAADNDDLPMRIRGDVDEAVPSATAQTIRALVQLSSATGDHATYEKAVRAAEAALDRTQGQMHGQAGIVHTASLAQRPMKLLISDHPRFVPVSNRIPDPRRVDILLGERETAAERMAGINVDRQIPGAWLCIGQSCLPPLRDTSTLEAALRAAARD